MSGPSFTPGPWAIVRNKYGEDVLVQPSTDRTLFLLDDGETTDWKLDEADANARLIAAAPDLYEALNALGGALGTVTVPKGHALLAAAEKANAALAKARGEKA